MQKKIDLTDIEKELFSKLEARTETLNQAKAEYAKDIAKKEKDLEAIENQLEKCYDKPEQFKTLFRKSADLRTDIEGAKVAVNKIENTPLPFAVEASEDRDKAITKALKRLNPLIKEYQEKKADLAKLYEELADYEAQINRWHRDINKDYIRELRYNAIITSFHVPVVSDEPTPKRINDAFFGIE